MFRTKHKRRSQTAGSVSQSRRPSLMKTILAFMSASTESNSITALAPLQLSWPNKFKTTKSSILSESGIHKRRMYHMGKALMVRWTLLVEIQFSAGFACVSILSSTPCLKRLSMLQEMERFNQRAILKNKNRYLEVLQLLSVCLESSFASLVTISYSSQSSTSWE